MDQRAIDLTTGFLIAKGFDPNAGQSLDGSRKLTPLHIAVNHNNINVVKLLIAVGVNVNTPDINGETPLHAATFITLDPEIAKVLLGAGASVNAKDMRYYTPLHYAALYNNVNVIRILLNARADSTSVNRNGVTAFRMAQVNGRVEAVAEFKKRGITQ